MSHLKDLFDQEQMLDHISTGHIRLQAHKRHGLFIYNYAEKAVYEKLWTPVTLACRGLIADADGVVVARPWDKFFNHGEGKSFIPPGVKVEITDKQDGSLGIGYSAPDGYAVATRGSFHSEQAEWATAWLRDRYPTWAPPPGYTPLWEIVYPENRIVLDYADTEELFLLGAVEIETGDYIGPHEAKRDLFWPGRTTAVLPYDKLEDILTLWRSNSEGVVVRWGNVMQKVKQQDYIELHRVVTNCTARTVWEHLAVEACGDQEDKLLVRELRISLERLSDIRSAGDWQAALLALGVPDEFYDWIKSTAAGLKIGAASAESKIRQCYAELAAKNLDRKAFAKEVSQHPDRPALFLLADGKDITPYVWRKVYPSAVRPFARSEATA